MSSPTIPTGGARTHTMPVHLSGDLSATTANLARIAMKGRHMVLGVDAIPRASTGTGQSCALTLAVDGTSILAAPLNITATAMASATMVNLSAAGGSFRPVIADGGVLSIGATLAGTNPVYKDITLSIHLAKA